MVSKGPLLYSQVTERDRDPFLSQMNLIYTPIPDLWNALQYYPPPLHPHLYSRFPYQNFVFPISPCVLHAPPFPSFMFSTSGNLNHHITLIFQILWRGGSLDLNKKDYSRTHRAWDKLVKEPSLPPRVPEHQSKKVHLGGGAKFDTLLKFGTWLIRVGSFALWPLWTLYSLDSRISRPRIWT
jgi:hypothetical protein